MFPLLCCQLLVPLMLARALRLAVDVPMADSLLHVMLGSSGVVVLVFLVVLAVYKKLPSVANSFIVLQIIAVLGTLGWVWHRGLGGGGTDMQRAAWQLSSAAERGAAQGALGCCGFAHPLDMYEGESARA